MLCGMSSVKEYWKRAHSTAQSDFETTSSDYSFDDSNSSISKEYRDASCNVDSDDSTHELVDENVGNRLIKNIDRSTISRTPDNDIVKTSRYVRWNVLMSLGIGLWAVLCIVDLLHSEQSFTRDWLHVSLWGKRIVTKVELPKKLENSVLWYSNLWLYAWKIMSIMTSGGAYALLFLLMVVFCTDPRFRNAGAHSHENYNVSLETSLTEPASDSIVEKKTPVFTEETLPRLDDKSTIPKIVSVRLDLPPPIDLRRHFFSSIEKCVQVDLKKIVGTPRGHGVRCSRITTRLVRIFDESDNGPNESATCFSIDRQLVELLDATHCPGLQLRRVEWIDWSSANIASVKDSTSLCLMNARRSNLNFNASTFDLEIGEYLRKTGQSSSNVFVGDPRYRGRQRRRTSLNFQPEASSRDETTRTRIITSSPAFKKFLSSFRHNSAVS